MTKRLRNRSTPAGGGASDGKNPAAGYSMMRALRP